MSLRAPSGFTLIEMLVAIAVFGILASVTAVAFNRSQLAPTAGSDVTAIREARRKAIASGSRVTITISINAGTRSVTALPDGSVVADSGLSIDELNGRSMTRVP